MAPRRKTADSGDTPRRSRPKAFEYGFTPSLSAKLEYRYIAAASLELSHIHEVLAGVNYRFGGPP
jgi:hypothetical protein